MSIWFIVNYFYPKIKRFTRNLAITEKILDIFAVMIKQFPVFSSKNNNPFNAYPPHCDFFRLQTENKRSKQKTNRAVILKLFVRPVGFSIKFLHKVGKISAYYGGAHIAHEFI